MSHPNRRSWGLISYTVGGTLLLLGVYYIFENVNKPWIDQELFMSFVVLPIGLAAFFLLGLERLLLGKSRIKTSSN